MARVTVTDCLKFIPNRYEIPVIAAQRVRDINAGSEPVVIPGEDRRPVVALREIATGKLDIQQLRNELLMSYKSSLVAEGLSAETLEEETIETKDETLSAIDAELEFNAELTDDSANSSDEVDESSDDE